MEFHWGDFINLPYQSKKSLENWSVKKMNNSSIKKMEKNDWLKSFMLSVTTDIIEKNK